MSNLPKKIVTILPSICDNFLPPEDLFMSILYCQIASRIIPNLQQNFLNMGLTPPPFEQCSKKLRYWRRMASLMCLSKEYIAELYLTVFLKNFLSQQPLPEVLIIIFLTSFLFIFLFAFCVSLASDFGWLFLPSYKWCTPPKDERFFLLQSEESKWA